MQSKSPAADSTLGGRAQQGRGRAGFTLVEIMVATALLVVILGMTASIISNTSKVWQQANAKVESFHAGRAAYEILTSRLAEATLNTYWDYFDAGGSPFRLAANPGAFVPSRYGRYSDLHFVCGQAGSLIGALPSDLSAITTHALFFTAPTGLTANANRDGLPGLLSACGYFVAFGGDDASRPAFLSAPSRWRWRLMELSAPVEELQVLASSSGNDWFAGPDGPVSQGRVRSVADNVIALILWPRRSLEEDPLGTQLSSDYSYDSRTNVSWSGTPLAQPVQANQLPPNLQVTMVVVDESAANRMANGSSPPPAITAALAGLFDGSVSEYDGDLQKLKSRLSGARIGHRVFSTTVRLRESKWSP